MKINISISYLIGLFLLCNTVHAQSIEDAKNLMEQSEYQQAEHIIRQLIKENPNGPEANFLLGQSLYQQDQFAEAIEVLKPLKSGMKSNADFFYYLGQSYKGVLLQTENFLEKGVLSSKAKEYLEKAVQLDPEHLDARESLAYYYFSAPGIAGGSKKKAFMQIAEIKQRDQTKGYALEGNFYYQSEDYPAAIKAYRSLIDVDGERANRYLALGLSYALNENYEEAFAIFEKIIAMDSTYAAAYYQYARTGVVSKTNVEQSIRYLKTFLTLNDSDSYRPAFAYWRLGLLYELQGKLDMAKSTYQKGLSLEPDHKQLNKALEALKD